MCIVLIEKYSINERDLKKKNIGTFYLQYLLTSPVHPKDSDTYDLAEWHSVV